jgi:hypothetical protein
MEPTLAEAVEQAAHAAGELTLVGLRLVFKETRGVETRASLTAFDEEAKVFLVREQEKSGEKIKAISPRKFKYSFLTSMHLKRMASFLQA